MKDLKQRVEELRMLAESMEMPESKIKESVKKLIFSEVGDDANFIDAGDAVNYCQDNHDSNSDEEDAPKKCPARPTEIPAGYLTPMALAPIVGVRNYEINDLLIRVGLQVETEGWASNRCFRLTTKGLEYGHERWVGKTKNKTKTSFKPEVVRLIREYMDHERSKRLT